MHAHLRMLALCAAIGWLPAYAQTPPPPVPSEYQDLYASLDSQIATFSSTVNAGWNGTRSSVAFSAHLASADAYLGPALLGSTHLAGTQLELNSLKALGAKAVTLSIGFPMLYAPFFTNQTDYQQYLNYYTQVASMVRAASLKLIVETQVVLPGGSLNVGP